MALKIGDVVVTNPGAHASIEVAEGPAVPCGSENGDVLAIDKTVLDFFEDAQDVKVTDAKNFDDSLKDLGDPNNANPNDLNNLEATAAGTADYAFGANGIGFLQFGNFNYHDPYSGLVTSVGQGGNNYYNTLSGDTRRPASITVNFNAVFETSDARLKEDDPNYGTDPGTSSDDTFERTGTITVIDPNPGESALTTTGLIHGVFGNILIEDQGGGVYSFKYVLAEPGLTPNDLLHTFTPEQLDAVQSLAEGQNCYRYNFNSVN